MLSGVRRRLEAQRLLPATVERNYRSGEIRATLSHGSETSQGTNADGLPRGLLYIWVCGGELVAVM